MASVVCHFFPGGKLLFCDKVATLVRAVDGKITARFCRSGRQNVLGSNSLLRKGPLSVEIRCNAMQADDRPPSDMTFESALLLLGVPEEASFDEILRAKKSITDVNQGNTDLLTKVEVAYDILLMQSLSRRRAGKIIDKSVKYADVRKPQDSAPGWVKNVIKATPLSVATPSSNTLAVQAAVFGALAAWTFVGGLAQGPNLASDGSDVPGLQLALGFGAALYFLRQQNVKLGKASLVTAGGVAAGTLLGSLIEAWLHVEIFPVLGISSPAVLVSEFTFLSLWVTSAYLR